MAKTSIKKRNTRQKPNTKPKDSAAAKASGNLDAPAANTNEVPAPEPSLAERNALLTKRISAGDFADLIEQVETEYQLSWWYMKPKFDEWALRLKLYNNQRRDKEAVGDPLLFTIHQTVLASLYNDQLMVDFVGREEGDSEVAENLGDLAQFDHDEMGKDEVDFYWDWDATFFGRGLVLLYEFDRDIMTPIPENLDPMTFMRDPRAKSVNGDRKGRGALRFWGRPIRLTKNEMKRAGVYVNYDDVKPDNTELKNFLDEATRLRDEAQGRTDIARFKGLKGENADSLLLEWNTYFKGKRVLVTLADNRKKIVRYHEYPETMGSLWPLLDRPLFPMSNDWDGVSIPDLVEDKQRARAVLQNLGLKGAKSNVHPMYLYDSTRIKNRGDLNFGFNKFIAVDGNPSGAVTVMPKDALKQEVSFILDLLDQNAQRATATPDMQQGAVTSEKRTLGELNLVNAKVDTRYSLSARIFGWSEKRFWKMWYLRYKENFVDGIDEKMLRVAGAVGYAWRPLRRANIIAETDPDIKIESKVVADAKRYNDLQAFTPVITIAATDPNSNMRYAQKRLARLSGMKKDEIDMLYPPVAEELRARDENKQLEEDKLVEVQPTDDHRIHMEVHNSMSDTPAKYAHINAHKKAMMLQSMGAIATAPSAQNPNQGKPVDNGKPAAPAQPVAGAGKYPAAPQAPVVLP